MANNLTTLDPVQTLRVQPVPLPEIPLDIYSPATFGAGLAAGMARAGENMAQVATIQRHLDANAAAMDAESQLSQDTADMLVDYREKIQSMTGEELKKYTKKFQGEVEERAKMRGAKLTDQIAANEYAKRAGNHTDRLYQVAGELSFQRQTAYRKEVIDAQEKLTIDASGVVQRGPDGLPVAGPAKQKDLQNTADALQQFAESVHNDPSMVTLQNGVMYLNPAGQQKIMDTTVKSIDQMLMAYAIKPREGMAMLRMTYPGTNQTVADVLGAHATHWQRVFSEGDKSQTASGLGYEAQRKFGQGDRRAEAWIREQVAAQYPNPEEASAVSAAAVNQYTHFANQKIQRQNTLEAQVLKAGQDLVLQYGGWEEMMADPKGQEIAAQWGTVQRKKVKEFSDTWKSGDPESTFGRAFTKYQLDADLNPMSAFSTWTDADIIKAEVEVGPKLAPKLRDMVMKTRAKKFYDEPGIVDARKRATGIIMDRFNLQKDPTDPLKPNFENSSPEVQTGFMIAQMQLNAAFDNWRRDNKTGSPTFMEVDGWLRTITTPVKVKGTIGSWLGITDGVTVPVTQAAAMGRALSVPYDLIPPPEKKLISDAIRQYGIPPALKGMDEKQVFELMYQGKLERTILPATKPLPSRARP